MIKVTRLPKLPGYHPKTCIYIQIKILNISIIFPYIGKSVGNLVIW
nr:MAG TPA: hypothetical protein [Caudoviricetes sp.]